MAEPIYYTHDPAEAGITYWDEDDLDEDDVDDGDVRDGECDRCLQQPGEMIPPFGIHCWCWGGQGADRADCRCPWGYGAEPGHPVDPP